MATKRKQKSAAQSLPEGFHSARRKRADGFYIREPGAIVAGRLLDRFEVKLRGGKVKAGYTIRTAEPCTCKVNVSGEGEEADYQTKTLPAGSVVAVDETADLRVQLRDKAESDTAYDVWIRCESKEDIGDSQTLWRFTVGVRNAGAKADEDVPF